MRLSQFLLLVAAMLVAPKIQQGYVLLAVVLALLAFVVEFIDRRK